MSLLEIKNLHVEIEDEGKKILNGLNLTIEKGQVAAIMGPNGSGKSTTFNMINGQLAADTGEILIGGKSIAGMAPRDIWRLGVGRTFKVAATFG